MSYTDTSSEEIFDGDNATTAWAYTQNTAAEANVKVRTLDSDGVPSIELVNGTHFDLAGVGGSGGITVTYPKASSPPSPYDVVLTASEKIVIWVEPPADQPFEVENTDTYSPANLGLWMNNSRRLIQKLRKDVSRSYHVALGADAPADGAVGTVSSSKILLAETTVSGEATASVTSNNWPATYEQAELEIVYCVPASESAIRIKPIDNGSATETTLSVTTNVIYDSTSSVTTRSGWSLDIAFDIGTTADDWLTGSAVFRYFNEGYLNGVGHFTHRKTSTLYGTTAHFLRHASVFTRCDGFQLSAETGANLSCKIRLWGIPNS